MTEFTREIKSLEKAVTSTPQAPMPTGNLGSDVVGLAGTALQLYNRGQAEQRLAVLREKDALQEKTMSEGILGLRDLRQSLVNQGVTGRRLLDREQAYLSQYDPTTRLGIVGGAKKATGVSLSSATKEAQGVAEAQRERNLALVALTPYATRPFPSDGSAEDVAKWEIEAAGRQAEKKALAAEYTLDSQRLGVEGQQERQKVKLFGAIQSRDKVTELQRTLNEILPQVNLDDPKAKAEMMQTLDSMKAAFRQTVDADAERFGVVLSRPDRNAILEDYEAVIGVVERQLNDESFNELSETTRMNRLNTTLDVMYKSDDPAIKQAAMMYTVNKDLGQSLAPKLIVSMLQNITDGTYPSAPDGGEDTEKKKQGILSLVFSAFSDPNATAEAKTMSSEYLESVFSLPPKRLKSFVSSGDFSKYISELGKYPDGIPEADKLDVFSAMKPVVTDVLSSTTSNFLSESFKVGGGSARDTAIVSVMDGVELNEQTLTLTTTELGAGSKDLQAKVSNFNKVMSDAIKAYQALGASESQISEFKADISAAYQLERSNRSK